MKKKIILMLLLLIGGPLLGHAQQAQLRKALGTLAEVKREVSSVTLQRDLANRLQPYLVYIPPLVAPLRAISFSYYEPTPQQQLKQYEEFGKVRRLAIEEVHSLRTFVYYQTIHPQPISYTEIGNRLARLEKTQQQVSKMRLLLEEADETLDQARRLKQIREKIMSAREKARQKNEPEQVVLSADEELDVLSANLQRGILYYQALGTGVDDVSFELGDKEAHSPEREDRPLDINQFFLYPPQEAIEHRYWPQQFRLAVLTDSKQVNNAFRYWANNHPLFQNWTVDVWADPDDFINNPFSTSYDMLLTDVMIPNGGGTFVMRKLREGGFEKPIIALTEFDEADIWAKRLFHKGYDGMISREDVDVNSPSFEDLIFHKLNNYFYYRAVNGWDH